MTGDVSAGWRETYRAQGVVLPDGGRHHHRPLPEIGDHVRDREDGRGKILVVLDVHPDVEAAGWYIDALDATVAQVNPDYEPDAPVVEAVYVDALPAPSVHDLRRAVDDGKRQVYSFPAGRLVPVDGRERA